MNRLLAVAYILFCLEIGAFLMFVPWSAFWDNNVLLAGSPGLQSVFLNNYFKGAVTGLGVIDCLLGLAELGRLIRSFGSLNRSEG